MRYLSSYVCTSCMMYVSVMFVLLLCFYIILHYVIYDNDTIIISYTSNCQTSTARCTKCCCSHRSLVPKVPCPFYLSLQTLNLMKMYRHILPNFEDIIVDLSPQCNRTHCTHHVLQSRYWLLVGQSYLPNSRLEVI